MRFQLEGASLLEIHQRAIAEYGQHIRIVSAERVTVGGIGGFLAKSHLEAIIEVPNEYAPEGHVLEPGDEPAPQRAIEPAPKLRSPKHGSSKAVEEPEAGRPASPAPDSFISPALTPDSPAVAGGIDGLLARADEAELRLAPQLPVFADRGTLTPLPGRPDFDRLLDSQAFALEPATGTRAAGGPSPRSGAPRSPAGHTAAPGTDIVPSPLAGPGDLVVVIGLWGDAGMGAGELDEGTALRRNAGELAQKFDTQALARRPILDRRGILRARATAVADGVPLLVSVAINPLLALPAQLHLLEVLAPDQLWVAVDAGRKAEDSAAWVQAVAKACGIYGVVSLHAEETLSPETVWELGFPVLETRDPGA
ncbi:hypothetical protein KRR55_12990 [Paeniglutamicibacter sp. ABSL32-1]|uniref:hypothetical protein n=1 Tax=Paeniglutamicibacter quisquiliarum TaxID=2849498 RepID=UPI001C2D05DE|nr:hypothetical protein [Paeniglutamicibacter quisquiliarum]MBV1780027.1 hypothetical protein [Paeniglutamicibacter quisquiliarum]